MSNRNFDSRVIIQRLKEKNQAQNLYGSQSRGQTIITNPQNSNPSPQTILNYKTGSETTYWKGLLGGAYTVDTGAVANLLVTTPPAPPASAPSTPFINNTPPPREELSSISLTIYINQDSDGGRPITNYEYSINNGGTFQAFNPPQTPINLPLPSTNNKLTIYGLTPNTTYQVIVKAVNSAGTSSASNMKSYTTLQGA
jgi:hypothetical protein